MSFDFGVYGDWTDAHEGLTSATLVAKLTFVSDEREVMRETKAGWIVQANEELPRIIEFIDVIDYGPCDDGATAICPHCGAEGRYVHSFRCDDGTTRGAMKGCVKLFRVAPIALTHQKLCERRVELRKRYGRDATLNSWDARVLNVIERFYADEIDEAEAGRLIEREETSKMNWRAKKYGGRR